MNAAVRALLLGGAAIGLAIACALWPLSVWAATLAVFGVPHALVELRWVGRRYGRWRALLIPVVALLALIGTSRLLAFQLDWRGATLAAIELALGMLLVASVLPRDTRRCVLRSAVATLALTALGYGVANAPLDTLLVLAVLHNVTPVGLIADRLRDPDLVQEGRTRWTAAALLGFVLVPAWLATGVAANWLGLESMTTTPGDLTAAAQLDLGLADGLAAFVPGWLPRANALDLLRAAAFLQCLHYVAVLVVLPRLGAAPNATRTRRDTPFLVLVAGLGALFFAAFGLDFRESKATYGILAAVHVWAEFPALLLALTPRAQLPVTP
ncbi:MAG: hypothetical protein H6838_09690 [Planctomycetes bacterium]|nr:hypothetical protein [Planctomycetota bacterium]MCB9885754.1 hypothetical protein [Planctomycetota bacterium]